MTQALSPTEIPLAFYQWSSSIELDVRVSDLTPGEIKALIAALSQSARPVASEGEAKDIWRQAEHKEWRAKDRFGHQPGEVAALVIQSALDAARAQERAEIVAWLQAKSKLPIPEAASDADRDRALTVRAAVSLFADAIATLQHKEAE